MRVELVCVRVSMWVGGRESGKAEGLQDGSPSLPASLGQSTLKNTPSVSVLPASSSSLLHPVPQSPQGLTLGPP